MKELAAIISLCLLLVACTAPQTTPPPPRSDVEVYLQNYTLVDNATVDNMSGLVYLKDGERLIILYNSTVDLRVIVE